MTKMMIAIALLVSLSAKATIDEGTMKSTEPSGKEVSSARSCFKELSVLGCGHPRDDLEQFKSCMGNIISSLTPDCQKMMSDLYSRKK